MPQFQEDILLILWKSGGGAQKKPQVWLGMYFAGISVHFLTTDVMCSSGNGSIMYTHVWFYS